MENFDKIVKPLYDLLKKPDTKGQVVPSSTSVFCELVHQAAIAKLITAITESPILAFPDSELPFVLHADTSWQGLVCALYQIQRGVTRVFGCGSCTFLRAEQKHYSSKLKFLALKWDFCDHFKEYLYYAKSCDLYIDNNLLAHVMSTGKLNATGQRWANELSD